MDSISERLGKTLLGKWRLDSLLGEGGMGAVYAATHRNGARGAVKMLHTRGAAEVSRFSREGYIANLVDHPAIVRALDDDVAEDGTPFLVMELLEGSALDAVARERGGQLPLTEVMRVMREVLDALAAAHDHGIVHRDIKPENIFVTVDGRVKVLDFGIAHLPEGAGPISPKTQCGMVMGTPGFMSPEQARGRWELVGPASDVWAVGATMFTLLSGELVHVEETVAELVAATFSKPVRSLQEVTPNLPRGVVALVDRALELLIDDRWGSAVEMREALLEVEAALDTAHRPPAPSSLASTLPPPHTGRSARRSAMLGALDLLSAIVMLALSAHCMVPGPSTGSARAANAPVELASLTPPALPNDVAEATFSDIGPPVPEPWSASPRRAAAPSPPTLVPSSTSMVHDRRVPHPTIYDRRY